MAKATHAQEVSTGTSDSYTPEELADPRPPVRIQRAMIGEVDRPLVGDNLPPSSETASTEKSANARNVPSPALKTENRSSQFAGTSTVDSADGDTPGAGKGSPKKSVKKSAKPDDDFDF